MKIKLVFTCLGVEPLVNGEVRATVRLADPTSKVFYDLWFMNHMMLAGDVSCCYLLIGKKRC